MIGGELLKKNRNQGKIFFHSINTANTTNELCYLWVIFSLRNNANTPSIIHMLRKVLHKTTNRALYHSEWGKCVHTDGLFINDRAVLSTSIRNTIGYISMVVLQHNLAKNDKKNNLNQRKINTKPKPINSKISQVRKSPKELY